MDPAVLQRLESGDQAVFTQLVAAVTSPDNDARKTAEDVYKRLLESRPAVTLRFLTAGLGQPTKEMKSFCTVMLRKAIKQEGVWTGCDPETKALVQVELIKQISTETDKGLMAKLCDTASELAAATWSTPDRWTDILTHMQQFIASQQDHLMQAALLIFSHLVLYLDDEFQQRAGTMYAVLQQCLKHANVAVQLAATTATCNFIQSHESEEEQLRFHDLVRLMLDVCGKCLASDAEDDAREILLQLAELADLNARMFKPHMRDFTAAMLQITENASMDEDTRQMSLELVLALVEGRPAMIRNQPDLLAHLVQVCMNCLLEIDDTPEWHASVEEEDADDGQGMLYEYGQEALDRIAKPIGGKVLMQVMTPIIQAWAQDADWKKRQAVLIAISQVAEGCRKVMLEDQMLASLMALCCGATNDGHAHVKWAACQAIGQVCTDLALKVQKKHHGDIMAALLRLMGPTEEPRVQAHAAAAIVNFSDGLDGNIVGLYAAQLTERLVQLLSAGNKLVQEGALTAISSVADSCQALFASYYDRVMPLLKRILSEATHKTQRRMRGKALECISLIGMAVGKERFMVDAPDFMNALHVLHSTPMDADDPMLSYMQSAGTRMCKCLGKDFMPMLGVFMPALLESAGKKPKLETFDKDEMPEDGDDDNYTMLPFGEKVLRVNTSFNEEKLNAFNMLCCYAEDLREAFFPYCAEVARLVREAMTVTVFFDDELRRVAAMMLPSLLSCVQRAAEKQSHPNATPAAVLEMFTHLWAALLKALKDESAPEVTNELLDSMEQLVDLANPGLISMTQAREAFELLQAELVKLGEAKKDRESRKKEADFDEEDAEILADEDEMDGDIMQQIVGCMGAFLRKLHDEVMPLVEPLLSSHFSAMLTSPASTPEERWIALMLVTDVVEFAPSSGRYLPQILPRLIEHTSSSDTKCCNAAVYGLGVVAEAHPEVYKLNHAQCVEVICATISRTAGGEDWEHARDNAVAALGKILAAHPDLTGGEAGRQLGALWLSCLPLYADTVEAGKQHKLLHTFLLANDARVLGADNANLLKVADVFVRVIAKGDELLDADDSTAFIAFFARELKPIVQGMGFNLEATVAQLEPADQHTFNLAMHGGLIQ